MQFSLHPIKTSRECFRILVTNERESLVIVWLLKPDLSIPFCSDLMSRQRVPPSSPPPSVQHTCACVPVPVPVS